MGLMLHLAGGQQVAALHHLEGQLGRVQLLPVLLLQQRVLVPRDLLAEALLLRGQLVVLPAGQAQGDAAPAAHRLLLAELAHLQVVQAAQLEVSVHRVQQDSVLLQVLGLAVLRVRDASGDGLALVLPQLLLVGAHIVPGLCVHGTVGGLDVSLRLLLSIHALPVLRLLNIAIVQALATRVLQALAVVRHILVVVVLQTLLLVAHHPGQGLLPRLEALVPPRLVHAVGHGLAPLLLQSRPVGLHVFEAALLQLALDGVRSSLDRGIHPLLAPLLQPAREGHAVSLDQLGLVPQHIVVVQLLRVQEVPVELLLRLGSLLDDLLLVAPLVEAVRHRHAALLVRRLLGVAVVLPVHVPGLDQLAHLVPLLGHHLCLHFALQLCGDAAVSHALASLHLVCHLRLAVLQHIGAAQLEVLGTLVLLGSPDGFLPLHGLLANAVVEEDADAPLGLALLVHVLRQLRPGLDGSGQQFALLFLLPISIALLGLQHLFARSSCGRVIILHLSQIRYLLNSVPLRLFLLLLRPFLLEVVHLPDPLSSALQLRHFRRLPRRASDACRRRRKGSRGRSEQGRRQLRRCRWSWCLRCGHAGGDCGEIPERSLTRGGVYHRGIGVLVKELDQGGDVLVNGVFIADGRIDLVHLRE
mmetsp:Transcript_33500/g.73803  ORF Transcript_33500/g.73803 Transcript_33500/m.73803 type:complete len:640 (+) Transcript_33500:2-1921(+)